MENRSMAKRVLIVDDQPSILTMLSAILEDEGYETVTTGSGAAALDLFTSESPDVVFLDVWLADLDGLEILQALRDRDPNAAVIMISGHGTASTAVKAMKMGACDFIEKPLSYTQVVQAVAGALARRSGSESGLVPALGDDRLVELGKLQPPPVLPILEAGDRRQRTLRQGTVVYGLGLHSGTRTGMALQPLPPDSGIHVVTLPTRTCFPAHVSMVADTDYATTLSSDGQEIRTVEHLLSALHAYGISNLLIKVHGEIPVLDGSALDFCALLEQVGIEEQDAALPELVIDRRYEVGSGGKSLVLEPGEGFSVNYSLSYPAPVGDQYHEFTMTSPAAYKAEIAPARTFGFMRDVKMMSELGLGGGGRLDNFILVGEDNVINTELRFPDEFVRHKILDIVGDLYLLGFPIRGKVTARYTGHRDNIAMLRTILAQNGLGSLAGS
jgi:UDP-3-O-acyl N-acetylglucosamine deacetylase